MTRHSDIAQLVEQAAVNRWVPGSSPGVGAINAGVRSYRQGHPVVTRKVAGSSPAAPAMHYVLASSNGQDSGFSYQQSGFDSPCEYQIRKV